MDGSEPTASSPRYQSPFQVTPGTTVRTRHFSGSTPLGETNSAFYDDLENRPHPVSDSALWLRADRGLQLDADEKVSRWLDLSGHGHDLIQPNANERPQFKPGNFPAGDALLFPYTPNFVGEFNNSGSLETDFIVEEQIIVTSLGAFDDGMDGFLGTIQVDLHRLDDNGTPEDWDDTSAEILATADFTSELPGTLRDDFRIKPLLTPLTLPPGRYRIAAIGFTEDRYRHVRPFVSDSFWENYFQGIRFLENYYKAGTLVFQKPSVIPVTHPSISFAGDDTEMTAPLDLVFNQPSTVVAVMREPIDSGGLQGLLRNAERPTTWWSTDLPVGPSGGPYRNDEPFYNRTPGDGRPTYLIHVADQKDSQLWLDGLDLTLLAGSASPIGRLSIGGGGITSSSPSPGELVELIIFERVLEETEILRLQKSLAEEYQLPSPQLTSPGISPDGGLSSGSAEVSLSHPLPGLEFRYGSEPTTSSALYQGPFSITQNTRVRAIATSQGYRTSHESEARFYFDQPLPPALARDDLETWLRSDLGVELDENLRVERWRDLSGNGMDAIQTFSEKRPWLISNPEDLQPVLRFDEPDDYPEDVLYLPEGYRDLSEGFTAMFVARRNETGSRDRYLLHLGALESSYTGIEIVDKSSDQGIYLGVYLKDRSGSSFISSPADLGSLSLITVTIDPDGVASIFADGILLGREENFPVPDDRLRAVNAIGGDYFSGEIAEVLIFSSSLNYEERLSAEAAIASRHGIAFPGVESIASSLDPSTFHLGSVNLNLTTADPEAVIRYTTDGSEPLVTSNIFPAPLVLDRTTRVKASAFRNGEALGPIFDEVFRLGSPLATGDGLLGSYFDGPNFVDLSYQRIDPSIDFRWGSPSFRADLLKGNFSVLWTGKIQAPLHDTYQFEFSADDLVQVWLDLNQDGLFEESELLIDTLPPTAGGGSISSNVELDGGAFYDLKIEYQDRPETTQPELSWTSLGLAREVIPQARLFSRSELEVAVAIPELSKSSQHFVTPFDLTISCPTEGSEIRYTLDGSIPSGTSPLYSSPLTIDQSVTVRAKAFRQDLFSSPVARADFQLSLARPAITNANWSIYPFNSEMVMVRNGQMQVEAESTIPLLRAELLILHPDSGNEIYRKENTFRFNNSSWLTLPLHSVPEGTYQLIIRVVDQLGATAEETSTIDIRYAPPAPFSFFSRPDDGTLLDLPFSEVRFHLDNFQELHLFRNGTLIFVSRPSSSSGFVNYTLALQQGQNTITAIGYREDGSSLSSERLELFYFPPGTMPFFTNLREAIFPQEEENEASIRALGTPDINLSADLDSVPGSSFTDDGMGKARFSWITTGVPVGSYFVPLTASASGQESNASLLIHVVPNTLYWQWMVERDDAEGTLAQLQPNADPDGDGASNLIELAFLTNPFSATENPLPVKGWLDERNGETAFIISIEHREGAANLFDFRLEQSPDLTGTIGWLEVSGNDFQVSTVPGNLPGVERSEFILDPAKSAKTFFQLVVSPKVDQ